MIGIHLEVNENILNKKALEKEKFLRLQPGNMFFILGLCTTQRAEHVGNVSVLKSESEVNPCVDSLTCRPETLSANDSVWHLGEAAVPGRSGCRLRGSRGRGGAPC